MRVGSGVRGGGAVIGRGSEVWRRMVNCYQHVGIGLGEGGVRGVE